MGNMGIQEEIITGFVQWAVSIVSIVGVVGICAVVWSLIKRGENDD